MKKRSNFNFKSNPLAAILAKYQYQPMLKDILAGKVIAIERKQALINLGFTTVSFLPKSEVSTEDDFSLVSYFQINYTGEFLLLILEKNTTILSLQHLHQNRLWERLKQIHFSYMVFYPRTEKSTWGGKILNLDGLKCFAPNSHIPKYYRREQRANRLLPVKILKVKKKKNFGHIVVSSRFAFLKRRGSFLNVGLNVGMRHMGCVQSTKKFGIFLSILGVKCLLHISEISDKRITDISTFHKKGSRIEVVIIYINREKGQIALSAKRVSENIEPFPSIFDLY